MNRKLILFLGFTVICILAFGFFTRVSNKPTPVKVNNKIQVTASFYPLYFFASEIGGDRVTVHNITPSGAEPHDYEPTAQDVAKIEKSKLLVLNGGVEAWGDKVRDLLKDRDTKIVTAGEGLLTRDLTEEGKTVSDPHVWLDPLLAKQEAQRVEKGFEEVDPANSSYYQGNLKILEDKLGRLDTTFKQGLSSCKQKDIITSHAAFGYLGARYGLNQVAITGISPDAEPSPSQLVDVAKFAKDNNVKFIFFEGLVSPKLSETIANEVGAKTLVLDPLEGLSNDDFQVGRNYFKVMQDNLKNLQTALECTR